MPARRPVPSRHPHTRNRTSECHPFYLFICVWRGVREAFARESRHAARSIEVELADAVATKPSLAKQFSQLPNMAMPMLIVFDVACFDLSSPIRTAIPSAALSHIWDVAALTVLRNRWEDCAHLGQPRVGRNRQVSPRRSKYRWRGSKLVP